MPRRNPSSLRRKDDREKDRQRKQKQLQRKGHGKREKVEKVARSGRIDVDEHTEAVILDLIAKLIREERELRAQAVPTDVAAEELARQAILEEEQEGEEPSDTSDDSDDSDEDGSDEEGSDEEGSDAEIAAALDQVQVDDIIDEEAGFSDGDEDDEEQEQEEEEEEKEKEDGDGGAEPGDHEGGDQDFEYSSVFAKVANLSVRDSPRAPSTATTEEAKAPEVRKASKESSKAAKEAKSRTRQFEHAVQGSGPLSKHQKKQLMKDLIRDERRNERPQATPASQAQIPELQALHQQRKAQAATASGGASKKKKRHSSMVRASMSIPGKATKPVILPRSSTVAEVEAMAKNKLGLNKKRFQSECALAFEQQGAWFQLLDVDFGTMEDGTQISVLPLTALADRSELVEFGEGGDEEFDFPAAAAPPAAQETRKPAAIPPSPGPASAAAVAAAGGGGASRVPGSKPRTDDAAEVGRALINASADIRDVAEEIEQQRRSAAEAARIGEELQRTVEAMRANPEYQPVLSTRVSLPAWSKREELLAAIREHQVVVVSGETGCGKTTQIPQFILDALVDAGDGGRCNIVCTQPRRISAIGVAERVASERLEPVGRTVGYQIRLSVKKSTHTRVLFCTTGVLLRKLLNPEYLASLSHLLVDEVHERQVDTDFLLTFIKQQLPNYPNLRVVLMSATVQHDLFSKYFENCPVLSIHGRTFPVHAHDLTEVLGVMGKHRSQAQQLQAIEGDRPSKDGKLRTLAGSRGQALSIDPDFLADLITYIVQQHRHRGGRSSNARDRERLAAARKQLNAPAPPVETEESRGQAILVFLPGIQAISSVSRALRKRPELADRDKFIVFELHGTMAPEHQRKVFIRPRPGQWKIVLSTNIAETSITVEDVTHVVDSGLVREMRYDPTTNMSSLQEVGISCASAAQRAGRAGRVQEGHCWRCYTTLHHDTRMPAFPDPEIRRIALEEVVLQVRLLDLGPPGEFLRNSPESPDPAQIGASIENLIQIGALEPTPDLPLTALGYHLAHMPVDVRIGKMLIMSAVLRCVDPILTIAASLSHRSPFVSDQRNKEAASSAHRRLAGNLFSDHLTIVKAYNEWATIMNTQGSSAAYTYCRDNFLSMTVFEDMIALREDLRRHLIDAGFISADESEDNYNQHATNGLIVSSAMCAGLYPRIAHLHVKKLSKKTGKRGGIAIDDNKNEMFLHPASVNFKSVPSMLEDSHDVWLLYHKQLLSTKLYLHDCTVVSPLSIVLFGGELQVAKGRKKILVDRWITFKMHEAHMVLFKHLRRAINDLLTLKVHNPTADVSRRQDLILHVVSTVFGQERKYTLSAPTATVAKARKRP